MKDRQNRSKILIVDDEKINLDILIGLLAPSYHVAAAKNGEQALARLKKGPLPRLILLDIMMSGMDGYEVCRKIKADETTRDIPVIFITSKTDAHDEEMGFIAGAVDYITKPFQGKIVLERVKTHLRIQELHHQLEKESLRFKSLAEAAFEGIIIHENGQILDANSEAGRLLGSPPEALTGRNLLAHLPAQCRESVSGENEIPREGEIPGSQNKSVPVEIRTKKMSIDDRPVRVTAIRDLSIQKAMEKECRFLLDENRVLKKSMKERYKFGNLIGRSDAMQSVYELIARGAASDFHVIIYGESGSGKELAARTIYEMSSRGGKPFVPVNCSAISESLFEREFFGHRKGSFTHADRDRKGFLDAAHLGTLFLDEIGEMKPAMQVKLLRVLENGEYIPVGETKPKKADMRIISATNKNLASMVSQGKFREDLFYRIHIIEIVMPPLRDRKEDIPLLIDHFLSRFSPDGDKPRMPWKITDALYNYDWPGNVRELQNAVQRFLATGQLTLPGVHSTGAEEHGLDSKENFDPELGLNHAVEALEHKMIRTGLERTGWHRGRTADFLKIPRRTLQRKMVKYGFRQRRD